MLKKIDHIRKLIAEDRLEEAFRILEKTKLYNEISLNDDAEKIILLNKANFNKFRNDEMASLPINKLDLNVIRKNLLELLGDAENRFTNDSLTEKTPTKRISKFSIPNLSTEKIIILIIGILVLLNAIYLLLTN